MSLIRNDSIFVNWRTRRRLKWLAKAKNASPAAAGSEVTADRMADQLLNKIIEQEHPEMVQLEKNLDDREAEVIERITENLRQCGESGKPASALDGLRRGEQESRKKALWLTS